MDSPVYLQCREADQHTTLYREVNEVVSDYGTNAQAQVAFTRPDAINYSAHDLAYSMSFTGDWGHFP